MLQHGKYKVKNLQRNKQKGGILRKSKKTGFPFLSAISVLFRRKTIQKMRFRRFVILLHNHPDGTHWDIMLESETALTTWSVPLQPFPLKAFECRAKILPDHRLHYLDYEGPVSNCRGFVQRLDSGFYEVVEQNQFRLRGKIFNGIIAIHENHSCQPEVFFQYFPRVQELL